MTGKVPQIKARRRNVGHVEEQDFASTFNEEEPEYIQENSEGLSGNAD